MKGTEKVPFLCKKMKENVRKENEMKMKQM